MLPKTVKIPRSNFDSIRCLVTSESFAILVFSLENMWRAPQAF